MSRTDEARAAAGREVGRRLTDPKAAGDVQIDIATAKSKAASRFEHRHDHRQTPAVPSDDRATRRSVDGRGHQSLEFHQDGARSLDAGEHRRARRPLAGLR